MRTCATRARGQADARLALIDQQLERMRVTAPFDGLVVSGDLSQALGAPVERGDVLFALAPLDGYRVRLKVDERDVGDVALGQTGTLALAADPDSRLPFAVTRLTPVSTAEEGVNFFVVEGTLDRSADAVLRPGMEGVGKIDIGERRLVWIWTRKAWTWAQMTLWSWWP
jgi:multidrug efflux pump subunit AcrA (membrane-fusion protein)